MNTQKGSRIILFYGVLSGLCGVGVLLSLSLGSVSTSMEEIGKVLWSSLVDVELTPSEQMIETVLWNIRLPRVLMALGCGMGLALAGATLQGLFRNPLADPGLIGISSGSSVGALVALMVVPVSMVQLPILGSLYLPLLAFAGGAGVTFLLYQLSKIGGQTHVSTLLLGGIAVNALAGAIIGGLLTFSGSDSLRQFTFWTLGSLQRSNWEQVGILSGILILGVLLIMPHRKGLNALLLGEAEAYGMGFDVDRMKRQLIFWSAAVVGGVVSFTGLIGFVGLVVPHVVRLLIGADHRYLMPGSLLLGGTLMIYADLFARIIIPPMEIPLGVITALIGAPFFIYLVWRRKHRWSWS